MTNAAKAKAEQAKPQKQPAPKPATTEEREHRSEQMPAGLALSRVASLPRGAVRPADILVLQRTIGNQAVQRLLTARMSNGSPASLLQRVRPAVVQRAITIPNVDYDPVAGQFRHGDINEGNFWPAVRNLLNANPFDPGHRNIRNNVIGIVRQIDFSNPALGYNIIDIPSATTAIVGAIRTEYGNQGRPINGAGQVNALNAGVRDGLVASIRDDPQLRMDANERAAFDRLAQAPNVQLSRAKGTANQINYNDLPNNAPYTIQNNVAARLTEIRNERARWTVGALANQYTLHTPQNGPFAQEILLRQQGLHYQGNHTNLAGWLPAVAVPVNQVAAAANNIYNAASPTLQAVLDDANAISLLAQNTNEASRLRRQYRHWRQVHMAALTDAIVKDSAMAALCQGVSAYIEFSMPGGISRLLYEPVNNRVYITAHYKWREGYNPFFQVNNFPAV